MSEAKGIKETKEMLAAVIELAVVLGPILKDGFQAGQDLGAIIQTFLSNESFKSKLALASDKASEAPSELADVSLAESIELLMVVVPELPKLIKAWQKIEIKAVNPVVA